MDFCLSPLLGYPVGILTVDVESPVTWQIVSSALGKVDRQIPITVSKGICVVVE